MAPQRIFLGWDGPFLPRVARWLLDRSRTPLGWDLSADLVVMPAGRAGRRLLEVLTEQAGDRMLVPPRIITLGELPEELYEPDQPIADELTCLLARMQALRQVPRDLLGKVVHRPPEMDDLTGWQMLARDIAAMSQALAAQGVSVDQVASLCSQAMDFPQVERWEALAQLEEKYRQCLAKAGWIDRHAARQNAIAQQRCATRQNIILAAVIDLNQTARRMLQQVSDKVTILLQAPDPAQAADAGPKSKTPLYDDWGGVVEQAWLDVPLELDQARLVMVDQPRDQAAAALQAMAQAAALFPAAQDPTEQSANWTPDQITIGLADDALAPTLERVLHLADIPVRPAVGQPILQTPPVRLLQSLAAFLSGRRFDDLAALLRHPDIEEYLLRHPWFTDPAQSAAAIADWLTLLDTYITEHLQGQTVGAWLGTPEKAAALKAVHDALIQLGPDDANASKPLAAWGPAMTRTLEQIYGHRELNPQQQADQPLFQAIQALGRLLADQAEIDSKSPLSPSLTFSQTIQFTLGRLADQRIVPPMGMAAVEMLGWLELPLDDAPALIITSVNEGFLPEIPRQDAFLTDSMRRVLGLMDHQRRLARDKAMLAAIVHSRPQVTLIAGRRSVEGDPLVPSRLLLACSPDKLAHRLLAFYQSHSSGQQSVPASQAARESGAIGKSQTASGKAQAPVRKSKAKVQPTDSPAPAPILSVLSAMPLHGAKSQFLLPLPKPPAIPIRELPVTAFRAYMQCPYRFYLRYVLKLYGLEDQALEMDGLAFGNLAHTVLQCWAKQGPVHSADPRELAVWMSRELDELMRAQYGASPAAALQIQQQLLDHRLQALAQWQAQQTREGWKVCTQWIEVDARTQLQVDGQPFGLRGRIDRIDHHPEHGYRLLDYKTGDAGDSPDSVHRSGGQWVDLQLPLYRQLADGLGVTEPIQLGYILLPKKLEDVGLSLAKWQDEELKETVRIASDIIRKVRMNVFWPPSEPLDDDFSELCLDGCLDRLERIGRVTESAQGGG